MACPEDKRYLLLVKNFYFKLKSKGYTSELFAKFWRNKNRFQHKIPNIFELKISFSFYNYVENPQSYNLFYNIRISRYGNFFLFQVPRKNILMRWQ